MLIAVVVVVVMVVAVAVAGHSAGPVLPGAGAYRILRGGAAVSMVRLG